jgi:hypothetical protein
MSLGCGDASTSLSMTFYKSLRYFAYCDELPKARSLPPAGTAVKKKIFVCFVFFVVQ